jgi:hypothetical protein
LRMIMEGSLCECPGVVAAPDGSRTFMVRITDPYSPGTAP